MLGYSQDINIHVCETHFDVQKFLKENKVLVLDIRRDEFGFYILYR